MDTSPYDEFEFYSLLYFKSHQTIFGCWNYQYHVLYCLDCNVCFLTIDKLEMLTWSKSNSSSWRNQSSGYSKKKLKFNLRTY
jgi:hypothetical protein